MKIQMMCKAIGNEERARLIVCLAKQHTVSQLRAQCHLSQSALSQHLRILRDARIVRTKRVGTHIYYVVVHRTALRIARLLINTK